MSKILHWLCIASILFLLTGCWNYRELDDWSVVTAMGVDKGEKGKRYRVSYQVVNSGSLAGGGGQSGRGTGTRGTPTVTYSSTGDNLYETIVNTNLKAPRKLFFAHQRLLLIGESVAREGIEHLLDRLERDEHGRLNIIVMVVRDGQAESLINFLSPLERISAYSLSETLKVAEQFTGMNWVTDLSEVINDLSSKGKEPLVSGVKLIGDQQMGDQQTNIQESRLSARTELNGVAMFKKGKLVRWLEGERARGVAFILNRLQGTLLTLGCDGSEKETVGIYLNRFTTKRSIRVRKNKPVIRIDVNSEGSIGEMDCPLNLEDPRQIERLQQKSNQKIKKDIREAIKTAQKSKSDIFGFGELLHQQDPQTWRSLKKDWPRHFAKARIEIKVHTFIRLTGMRINTYPNPR
ncbi:Ger(x)C family spore germination protein [Paludifilum halophilum]|uniref:Uncharacterized protein n=1 Tax=Paludifilum halophilum TaxID=1642702 RepID=A0A235B1W1_9BACL|nr:Ger(x)C family spore germination protein [Paludifilum halophilum]OYD06273.1 hypothetical protein CHM34_17060 [Paludifilum halophilum]